MHMHMHCTSTYIPSASKTHKCVGLIPNARFFSPPKWGKKTLFVKNNSVMNSYDPSLKSFNPLSVPFRLIILPPRCLGSSHQKPWRQKFEPWL